MPTPGNEKRLAIPDASGFRFVLITDIIHCQADGNYTQLHLKDNQQILLCRQLGKLEAELTDYGFIRIHYSHLIQLSAVQRFDRKRDGQVLLSNGQEVPVARNRRKQLLLALGIP